MIPVLLLLSCARHRRRQLVHAQAATPEPRRRRGVCGGVEYGKNWKACVQTGDPALKASTAQKIADSARQYAGDPDATDYAGGVLPAALENTQIANQAHVDVAINSTSYDDNTDYSDDGDGLPGTSLGNPCFNHPTGDSISAPGYWTDVKVKERDLPSLFGGIGLPLSKNGARARVEIRPAHQRHAIPPARGAEQCDHEGAGAVLRRVQRDPIGSRTTSTAAHRRPGRVRIGGRRNALGPPERADPTVGVTRTGRSACDSELRARVRRLPAVGTEVRLASQDNIDLNQSCSTLREHRVRGLLPRLSQIRVYNDGNADNQPRIPHVTLTGGCGGGADAYFSYLPTASAELHVQRLGRGQLGDPRRSAQNVIGNFSVSVTAPC